MNTDNIDNIFIRIGNAVREKDSKAVRGISEELRVKKGYSYTEVVNLFERCTGISVAEYEELLAS